MRLCLLLPLLMALSACSVNFGPYSELPTTQDVETFANERAREAPNEAAFVEAVISALYEGEEADLIEMSHASIADQFAPGATDQLYGWLDGHNRSSASILSYHWNADIENGEYVNRSVDLQYVIERGEDFPVLLLFSALQSEDGRFLLTGLRWHEVTTRPWLPPAEITDLHWIIAIVSILSPFLILQALLKVISTPGLRHRWLWLPGIFLSFPTYVFVWNTGELSWIAPQLNSTDTVSSFQIFRFLISGTEITTGGSFGSWTLTTAIPLGAIWLHYKWFTGQLSRKTDDEARMAGAGLDEERV